MGAARLLAIAVSSVPLLSAVAALAGASVPAGGEYDCVAALQTKQAVQLTQEPELESGGNVESSDKVEVQSSGIVTGGPGDKHRPSGVNLGGWLCLEDWFFSGDAGKDGTPQGHCLPPAAPTIQDPWPSEAILTKRLLDTVGRNETVKFFHAHRHSYLGNTDFEEMAALGIKFIRLPITWAAFADALTPIDPGAGHYNPATDTVIVPDPFYTDTHAWVTIPRDILGDILERAGDRGMKVLIDIHNYPGGSSYGGSFNGIDPAKPQFWRGTTQIGQKQYPLTEVGLWIVRGAIKWLEGLGKAQRRGLVGVTFMNEPAGLSSFFTNDPAKDYANESQVLDWHTTTSQMFRESALPGRGTKLYVNLIETAFKDFMGTVAPWYAKTFSKKERSAWAVMDVHFYIAWNKKCSGAVYPGGGGFLCDQHISKTRELLRECIRDFTEGFAKNFQGLRATSEFSMGTFAPTNFACTDKAVTSVFLEEQLSAFRASQIEEYFWNWNLPYGNIYQHGWSFKHFAGLEDPKPSQKCVANPEVLILRDAPAKAKANTPFE